MRALQEMTISKGRERKVDKGARHTDKSRLISEREAVLPSFAQYLFYTMLYLHPTQDIKIIS